MKHSPGFAHKLYGNTIEEASLKAALVPGVVRGGLPAGVQGPGVSSIDRQQLRLQDLTSSCCYMERSISFLLLSSPA